VKPAVSVFLVLVWTAASLGQTADQKKETIAYLHSLQAREGGYRLTVKATAPSLRATNGVLRALKYFGGKPKDSAATLAFVRSCFDKDSGGFADAPGGKPDVVLTAIGLMALVELKVPVEDFEKPAVAFMADRSKNFEDIRMAAAGLEAIGKKSEKNGAWLEQIASIQNTDGTFGKGDSRTRYTGSAVAAVLRLGGKVKDGDVILKVLDAGQQKDGGFSAGGGKASELETTYRVMRTYHMLGGKPARADDLRGFVARCRNSDGGYGVSPGQPSGAGTTYFASIILHWLE
jgi:hypothetical protein